jgi:hypothetical protein
MDSRPYNLKWSLLVALAGLAVVPSAGAEPPATNAWKSIIFSTPDNNVLSSNLDSPSTQPVPPANLGGGLFDNNTPVPSLNLGPAPTLDIGRRLQKKSDDRSDWVFQTPAEIMGVAPDQIVSNGKHNDDGQQKNLTSLERYLERRSPVSKSRMDSSPSRNYWGDENSQTNGDDYFPDLSNIGSDNLRSAATLGQPPIAVPGTVAGNNVFANPNADSVWSGGLGTPAPQPAPNPAAVAQQQAEMDQFRRMLNPGYVPVSAPTTVSDSASSFKSQINLPVSSSTQPLVNPIGASFAPLNSGIGQPAPLTQLPGITSPANTQPSLTPSWAPQPAPWTSPNPQPFAIPQRKF